ncbi:hypothetical protein P3X46_016464 [Hevea brasiliensis]|uniref:Lil3 protein n=1 Tax=Hevea brasiliensis TaxID=3981 RepID=A0ABQ9M0H0_HEVBR|nr:light-harvesting complex-like protein 3 isotype 1, chloroplastic [Hevea brasiliensis]KAJ9173313.1 hypothetical protein P3X46_016464 [Hevea brasiliensis]QGW67547.1 light-harvesting chlorophyll a/b-binding protein [Hevea brasiliensis]
MSISMALFSPPLPTQVLRSLSFKPCFTHKPARFLRPAIPSLLLSPPKSSTDNGAGISASVEELKAEEKVAQPSGSAPGAEESTLGSNGTVADAEVKPESKFIEPRWVGGTWDLKQFQKDGKTDWDAVIDAEVRRRKWLEGNPESSRNDDPVVFDTSIIPWWAWIKRFHLPEAELLNGRAAMIGFFMAYFVDSLTGVGLVDQMSNFFCKTLLFVAVAGVILIRKNEDIETLKKLLDETTFYDKQWQATWQDETPSSSKTE